MPLRGCALRVGRAGAPNRLGLQLLDMQNEKERAHYRPSQQVSARGWRGQPDLVPVWESEGEALFLQGGGVQSYYTPRSNPDGVAVTVACIDESTVEKLEVRAFDGANWEASYSTTGIADCSK
eukprot:CAMPEP_0177759964 /NCGR_PEP_ID=MMETSP0491_2-20121128/5011_1 /TAXON_ID=63592 /ORGANISM="Tetraselmis chuii, Strain PLY429" /LENGTH=122 /DNA_ID=CAMNT_0019275825 /DNA_START=188 /DNA_END=557 /DNA_ORIENTATION=-